jgi:hypothetical protein
MIVMTLFLIAVTAIKAAEDRDVVILAWLSGFYLVVGAVAFTIAGWVERRWRFPSSWPGKVRLALLIWIAVFLTLGIPTLALWLSLK